MHETGSARPPRYRSAGWGLAFSVLTLAMLAALAWGIWMMNALTYGVTEVMKPGLIPPPDNGRYGLALTVGVFVAIASTLGLVWLAALTPAGKWPPVVQGLLAATAAAVAAACAMLLALGINPLELLLSM